MSDTWSPDEPLGAERNEAWDEAIDAEEELEPGRSGPDGQRELDLEPALVVDDAEVEEAGVGLDDPERMATLEGGIDDPDGLGGTVDDSVAVDDGWTLDAAERLTASHLDEGSDEGDED